MPPENKGISKITWSFDGVEMGELTSISAEVNHYPPKKEIHNGEDVKFSNREYTGTLNNVQIDPIFADKFLSGTQAFDIVGEGYKLPRGSRLPKKKRIRKKWMKKYAYNFKLNNCFLH
ncbi:hypothetical protein [Bacillus infantis]|uniref:hypothetical protein n=1 Tax=Bacillus infantis TaxID=324767 RepID=UPI003CF78ACC